MSISKENKVVHGSDLSTIGQKVKSYVSGQIAGKENLANKTTSLSSSSNNTQYPSALCVYNAIRGLNGAEYVPVSSLPTASAATMGKIYVVSSTGAMSMTVESSGSYSWMQVGTLPTTLTAITNGEIDALFD